MAKADVKAVHQLDVGPGELPKTMTAWVIRQEREGEPIDAFQIEEMGAASGKELEAPRRVDRAVRPVLADELKELEAATEAEAPALD